jgi:hypothetical protein
MLIPSDIGADFKEEIQHLIRYIGKSGCIFIRNDREYDAIEAMKHIQKKYDYVKRPIAKTEDFIKYIASKSSVSGRQYRVRCGNQEMSTAKWLSAELNRFREKQGQKN